MPPWRRLQQSRWRTHSCAMSLSFLLREHFTEGQRRHECRRRTQGCARHRMSLLKWRVFAAMPRDIVERLRRRYRPPHLRLLFIGEAPPASGRFFYRGDSGLYRAMREAFRAMDSSITDENFLAVFQRTGCYLIDMCPHPVDRLDQQSRRAACLASVPSLSRRLRRLQPQRIVTLVRSIRHNVESATQRAGWRGPLLDLPYPGRWIRHREIFLDALVPQLRALADDQRRTSA